MAEEREVGNICWRKQSFKAKDTINEGLPIWWLDLREASLS